MITLAVKIDNRQFERKLERKKTYNFGERYKNLKDLKKDKYNKVLIAIDATEKCKRFKKKT